MNRRKRFLGYGFLLSSQATVTVLNILQYTLLGYFGGAEYIAAFAFSHATAQLLVNVASFRTDIFFVRNGMNDDGSVNASVLKYCIKLDVFGAFIYSTVFLIAYSLVADWVVAKFSIDFNYELFLLPWAFYLLKQTLLGFATASERYSLLSSQGIIAAVMRVGFLAALCFLGFDPLFSIVLGYVVSELFSIIQLSFAILGEKVRKVSLGLPVGTSLELRSLYFSSIIKINDANYNESLIPIIADPKIAACLILLRKAFSLLNIVIQPLSKIFMGSQGFKKNRNVFDALSGIKRISIYLAIFGLIYITGISFFGEQLGVIGNIDDWQVEFFWMLIFGLSILIRSLLWWVQPFFSIYGIKNLYLFNGLVFMLVVGLYSAINYSISYKDFFMVQLAFYAFLGGLFIFIAYRHKVLN